MTVIDLIVEKIIEVVEIMINNNILVNHNE